MHLGDSDQCLTLFVLDLLILIVTWRHNSDGGRVDCSIKLGGCAKVPVKFYRAA